MLTPAPRCDEKIPPPAPVGINALLLMLQPDAGLVGGDGGGWWYRYRGGDRGLLLNSAT